MKKLLLPLLLALIGLGGGIGAGVALRPAPPETAALTDPCGDSAAASDDAAQGEEGDAAPAGEGEPTHDFVKLNNQFIVPVVEGADVAALVILSISLEVALGSSDRIYAQEPKLRDVFLQVLFDHANAGGFEGAFTASNTMDVLRHALLESARSAAGPDIQDVLIVDIVRQDS